MPDNKSRVKFNFLGVAGNGKDSTRLRKSPNGNSVDYAGYGKSVRENRFGEVQECKKIRNHLAADERKE